MFIIILCFHIHLCCTRAFNHVHHVHGGCHMHCVHFVRHAFYYVVFTLYQWDSMLWRPVCFFVYNHLCFTACTSNPSFGHLQPGSWKRTQFSGADSFVSHTTSNWWWTQPCLCFPFGAQCMLTKLLLQRLVVRINTAQVITCLFWHQLRAGAQKGMQIPQKRLEIWVERNRLRSPNKWAVNRH